MHMSFESEHPLSQESPKYVSSEPLPVQGKPAHQDACIPATEACPDSPVQSKRQARSIREMISDHLVHIQTYGLIQIG